MLHSSNSLQNRVLTEKDAICICMRLFPITRKNPQHFPMQIKWIRSQNVSTYPMELNDCFQAKVVYQNKKKKKLHLVCKCNVDKSCQKICSQNVLCSFNCKVVFSFQPEDSWFRISTFYVSVSTNNNICRLFHWFACPKYILSIRHQQQYWLKIIENLYIHWLWKGIKSTWWVWQATNTILRLGKWDIRFMLVARKTDCPVWFLTNISFVHYIE